MPTATIINVWQDATSAYMAALVDEGGSLGRVEYVGSVPLADLAGLTNAQKKEALRLAVKAVRDAQLTGQAPVAGITGTVTV